MTQHSHMHVTNWASVQSLLRSSRGTLVNNFWLVKHRPRLFVCGRLEDMLKPYSQIWCHVCSTCCCDATLGRGQQIILMDQQTSITYAVFLYSIFYLMQTASAHVHQQRAMVMISCISNIARCEKKHLFALLKSWFSENHGQVDVGIHLN